MIGNAPPATTFTAFTLTPLTARRLNAPTAELVAADESWLNRGVPVKRTERRGYRTITMPEPPAPPMAVEPVAPSPPPPPLPVLGRASSPLLLPLRLPPGPPEEYTTFAPEMLEVYPVPPGVRDASENAFCPAVIAPPPPEPLLPELTQLPPSLPKPIVFIDKPPLP